MSSEFTIGTLTVRVQQGDLTDQETDAIVNAANNDLVLGAGVAGAIARRGGPTIQQECDRIAPIAVGEAALTGGGNLPARYVLHAASMRLGGRTTREALRSSMDACFRICREHGITKLALPAVGTGIARLSMTDCAEVMAETVTAAAAADPQLAEVRFVLFDDAARDEFERAFRAALSAG
jgi:O-acetyl-ADP-ribose deacetylase (regulator of RNase III)